MRLWCIVLCLLAAPYHATEGQGLPFGRPKEAKVELFQADRTRGSVPSSITWLLIWPRRRASASRHRRQRSSNCCFSSSVQFYVDGKVLTTDNRQPYWSSEWKPTVGKYKVEVKAYRFNNGNGRVELSNTVSVTVVNSNTKAPAVSPRAAPVQPAPVTAPVVAPTATTPSSPAAIAPIAPMTTPSTPVVAAAAPKAPVALPAAPTVQGPAVAPAVAPTVPAPAAPPTVPAPAVAPTVAAPAAPSVPVQPPVAPAAPSIPVQPPVAPAAPSVPVQAPLASVAPVQPPKAPSAPTKAPITGPTPCVSDIVSYINTITLSKQTLSTSGGAPLDRALKELNESNSRVGVQLLTCVEADKDRLRQRFAYYALIYSVGGLTAWFDNSDECAWNGIQCTSGRVTALNLGDNGLGGTIPADVALWTNLTSFTLRENGGVNGVLPTSIGAWTNLQTFKVDKCQLGGSLPSTIGIWRNLTNFAVYSNRLTGTVPTELSKWTAITEAYFDDNSFNGTMPPIGSSFCPKNTSAGVLWADCKPPDAEIACACCSKCCDASGSNCA
jgi:hypothetical protein